MHKCLCVNVPIYTFLKVFLDTKQEEISTLVFETQGRQKKKLLWNISNHKIFLNFLLFYRPIRKICPNRNIVQYFQYLLPFVCQEGGSSALCTI